MAPLEDPMTTEREEIPSDAQAKRRPLVVSAAVRITGHRKARAEVRDHTIHTAESERTGGDGSAPSPLQYFVSSVVF